MLVRAAALAKHYLARSATEASERVDGKTGAIRASPDYVIFYSFADEPYKVVQKLLSHS